jgi:hypothetical protein
MLYTLHTIIAACFFGVGIGMTMGGAYLFAFSQLRISKFIKTVQAHFTTQTLTPTPNTSTNTNTNTGTNFNNHHNNNKIRKI